MFYLSSIIFNSNVTQVPDPATYSTTGALIAERKADKVQACKQCNTLSVYCVLF